MERVVYISNSEKNISDFKSENLFGLPYEIVGDTDIVFGETVKKAKQMTALMNAFTLVETVVAMAIFSIIVSMVATLMVSISNFNLKAQQTTKAAIYINNVREALNTDIDNIKEQYLTTVKPMHEQFVEPSKKYADIIILEGSHNTVAVDLLKTTSA